MSAKNVIAYFANISFILNNYNFLFKNNIKYT